MTDIVPFRAAQATMAVLHGADSVQAVAARMGSSTSTAHKALLVARAEGLIRYEPGHQGTLRSKVLVANTRLAIQ